MTGTLAHLAAAMALFIATHIGLSSRPVRTALIARLGKWGFVGAYSVVAGLLLWWAITAFLTAPHVEVFVPGTGFKHASLTVMLIAVFLIVAGYTTPNPGIMGMEARGLQSGARGVLKITRHPITWGVALWGLSHALANGHAAALIFFGGLTALALAGAAHIDTKRRAKYGEAWTAYEQATSFWPLGAVLTGRARVERGEVPWWQTLLSVVVYVGILWGHARMGRDVFPMAMF